MRQAVLGDQLNLFIAENLLVGASQYIQSSIAGIGVVEVNA
jgi:hypothetical protein